MKRTRSISFPFSLPALDDRRETIWPTLTSLTPQPASTYEHSCSVIRELRCSFANPSGRPAASNGLNTNFQFVRAYRPGAQERDTNARCNQRIAKEGALQRNPRVNPRSSSAVTLPLEKLTLLLFNWREGCLSNLWYHFRVSRDFVYKKNLLLIFTFYNVIFIMSFSFNFIAKKFVEDWLNNL